jgi:hypothetical protein
MGWGRSPVQPRRCTTCGTLHLSDPSSGYPGRPCYFDAVLLPAVAGVELTANDRSRLAWLAGCLNQAEAHEFASFLRRLREAGPTKEPT